MVRSIRVSFGILFALSLSVQFVSAGPQGELAKLFAELNALRTANYTGGLPRKNRDLAARIRSAMLPEFRAAKCGAVGEGTVIAFEGSPLPPLSSLSSNLSTLVRAFDHERQEVRDTAAYAVGLLGPSAKQAAPFVERHIVGLLDSKRPVKGGWYNDTLAKLICDELGASDFRTVIPDAMLPPVEPKSEFKRKAAILLATLYLDEDIEYPPGMMARAYSTYDDPLNDEATDAIHLLAQVLENPALSAQKHFEAAFVLRMVEPQMARPALSALLRHANTSDPDVRREVTEALLRQKHEAAIPGLTERIKTTSKYEWERQLCEYGVTAISAESTLLEVIRDERAWPSDVHAAVNVLGCIRSKNALSALIDLLKVPDWETQERIAKAFAEIGDQGQQIVAALEALARKHWSRRVRQAAVDTLVKFGLRPASEASKKEPNKVDDVDVVRVGGPPPSIYHGLPKCSPRGRFSIGGAAWFPIAWKSATLEPLPRRFPKLPIYGRGTRAFMAVDDGWLYGANLGHYGGLLRHVSTSGTVTDLEGGQDTPIAGFHRDGTRVLAFGFQILRGDSGGSLFEVRKNSDGKWESKRVVGLPSPPLRFAAGPGAELFLADELSTYGVIANDIVPLKCVTSP